MALGQVYPTTRFHTVCKLASLPVLKWLGKKEHFVTRANLMK